MTPTLVMDNRPYVGLSSPNKTSNLTLTITVSVKASNTIHYAA